MKTEFFLTESHWVYKPLLQSSIICSCRWVTQNKHNDILGISLCHNVIFYQEFLLFPDLTSPLQDIMVSIFMFLLDFGVCECMSICPGRQEWRKMYSSLKTMKKIFLRLFSFVSFYLLLCYFIVIILDSCLCPNEREREKDEYLGEKGSGKDLGGVGDQIPQTYVKARSCVSIM